MGVLDFIGQASSLGLDGLIYSSEQDSQEIGLQTGKQADTTIWRYSGDGRRS